MPMYKTLRFGVHLPFSDIAEERAASLVIQHFEFEYGGSTYSLMENPVFRGTWKSPITLKNFEADICLLNIDVVLKDGEKYKYSMADKIEKVVMDINDFARNTYTSVDRTQESFWITITEMRVSMAA